MALFKYLTKEKDKLVEGEEFVKANELVEEINESRRGSPTPSKRGTYKIFSPKQRYEIGQYASEILATGILGEKTLAVKDEIYADSYFRRSMTTANKAKIRYPRGEEFVKANELVEEIKESRGGSPTPSKRGTYKIFSPKQRYEIGKYASEHVIKN
jgi:hypothetical protein